MHNQIDKIDCIGTSGRNCQNPHFGNVEMNLDDLYISNKALSFKTSHNLSKGRQEMIK